MYGIRYAPVVVMQVTFSAGTLFLLAAVRALSGARVAEKRLSDSMKQAEECVQYLGKMSKSYESAQEIKEILENMTRAWVVPRLRVRLKGVASPSVPQPKYEVETHPPSSSNQAEDMQILEPWEHHIPNSSGSPGFFIHQQPMDAMFPYPPGESNMLGGQILPNQPFVTFSQEPTHPYPDFFPEFSSLDTDVLVADTGMSAQELMDDLARFWR